MGMKLTRRVVVLAKLEATYGVDSVPTPAANAVLCCGSPDVKPAGDMLQRDAVSNFLSATPFVVAGKTVDFDLEVELKGGGLVTTVVQAPEYDPLLQACGMVKQSITELTLSAIPGTLKVGSTVTDDTSAATGTVAYINGLVVGLTGVTGIFATAHKINTNAATINGAPVVIVGYAPVSDPASVASCTIYMYRDGILHKATGCRGSFELNIPNNKYGKLKFAMHGIWGDPADAVAGTPAFSALVPPACVALGLTLAGVTPVGISALSLNLGADVAKRPDINTPDGISGWVIKDRNVTGSLDPEADTLANFNPWAAWKSGTPTVITGKVGTVSGNSVQIFVPQAQYSEVKYGDRDGVVIYSLPYTATMVAGDDEFRLLYR